MIFKMFEIIWLNFVDMLSSIIKEKLHLLCS